MMGRQTVDQRQSFYRFMLASKETCARQVC
jgi:hypothetical protein